MKILKENNKKNINNNIVKDFDTIVRTTKFKNFLNNLVQSFRHTIKELINCNTDIKLSRIKMSPIRIEKNSVRLNVKIKNLVGGNIYFIIPVAFGTFLKNNIMYDKSWKPEISNINLNNSNTNSEITKIEAIEILLDNSLNVFNTLFNNMDLDLFLNIPNELNIISDTDVESNDNKIYIQFYLTVLKAKEDIIDNDIEQNIDDNIELPSIESRSQKIFIKLIIEIDELVTLYFEKPSKS